MIQKLVKSASRAGLVMLCFITVSFLKVPTCHAETPNASDGVSVDAHEEDVNIILIDKAPHNEISQFLQDPSRCTSFAAVYESIIENPVSRHLCSNWIYGSPLSFDVVTWPVYTGNEIRTVVKKRLHKGVCDYKLLEVYFTSLEERDNGRCVGHGLFLSSLALDGSISDSLPGKWLCSVNSAEDDPTFHKETMSCKGDKTLNPNENGEVVREMELTSPATP